MSVSRIEAVAHRWVRLIGVVAFAASVGVGVWSIMRGPIASGGWPTVGGASALAAALAAAVVIVIAPIMEARMSLLRVVAAVGGLFGLISCCVWSALRGESAAHFSAMTALGQILGSLLIGSVTLAWLLGHAYLTATRMTIAPLKRLSGLFLLAVGLRWAFLAACLTIAYASGTAGQAPEPGGGLMSLIAGAWLIVSLRVAVGLMAVSLFAYMVWDCVKLRSTQSATGILYFASVFVYIGELSSQHLLGEIGIPL